MSARSIGFALNVNLNGMTEPELRAYSSDCSERGIEFGCLAAANELASRAPAIVKDEVTL